MCLDSSRETSIYLRRTKSCTVVWQAIYTPDQNVFGADYVYYNACDAQTHCSHIRGEIVVTILLVKDQPMVFDVLKKTTFYLFSQNDLNTEEGAVALWDYIIKY